MESQMKMLSINASSSNNKEHGTRSNNENDENNEQEIIDKSRDIYQRTAWNRLGTTICYLVSITNSINIGIVKKELLRQNMIIGKHLFCHFIIQAQLTSPSQNTHVYATLVAVINLELPEIGGLVLNRFIMKFKSAYSQEHYAAWFSCLIFIGHLINHSVADEMLAVELLTLIFEQQTTFSFEIICVAIQFLEICGKNISYVFQTWLIEIFDKIHNFVNDKQIDIEVRKCLNLRLLKLRDNQLNSKYFDLVPLYACQTTHFSTLDSVENNESYTIGYRYDPEFESNEKKNTFKLQKYDNEESVFESITDFNNYDGENNLIKMIKQINNIENPMDILSLRNTCIKVIIDRNLINICNNEEFVHKLVNPGQELNFCFMIFKCCCEKNTYSSSFGYLVKELCNKINILQDMMEILFIYNYITSYSFDIFKAHVRSRFFAHLFKLGVIRHRFLTMIFNESISPNKIYISILKQDLTRMSYKIF